MADLAKLAQEVRQDFGSRFWNAATGRFVGWIDRAYYAKPGCGALQGGGPPGGLGMDQEFLESVLVPQVMLYGFLGFTPGAEGYTLKSRLPKDWPSLTVTGVRFHDKVLGITAFADGRTEIK